MYLPDVSERIQFYKELGCGNFEWYMVDMYPDLYIVPFKDILLHGEICLLFHASFLQ